MSGSRSQEDWEALRFEASQVFSPSAPVDERALFAGRTSQISKILEVIAERGKHAVLYGERGVGKTSLAKVVHALFPSIIERIVLIREQVDPTDNFSSIWRKVFKDISITLRAESGETTANLAELYQNEISPDDVRRELELAFRASQIPVIIIDEFDKSEDTAASELMANLIKHLSDYSVHATVIIVGVADDISQLIAKHESISRCLEQIPMPRMSNDEMKEILQKRLPRLDMEIAQDAMWKIITLSRGLPSYVHLLGLYATQDAILNKRTKILEDNVDAAIRRALERSQESVRQDYAAATHTNRTDTLFEQVLLACALAKTDDTGLFTPNSVVAPLSSILGRSMAISNFQNHLKKFISDERARVLVRRGKDRAYKFRFRDPMMQPYVIMGGVESGLVKPRSLDALSSPAEPELPI